MSLKYITIQDLGYDPNLIEASIEIAEVASNRSLFQRVVNQKFEHCIDNRNLRYIFQTTDDMVDFAKFIVYCMVNSIGNDYLFAPYNSNVQKLKKST